MPDHCLTRPLEPAKPHARWVFTAALSRLAAPRGQSEVLMSRMLLGASAAGLIFAFAHAAFADEAGAVTGGVAGAVGGAAVGGPVGAVVGGVGGAAVGNSMTNHRRYYHGYAYYPYHHHHHHYYGER